MAKHKPDHALDLLSRLLSGHVPTEADVDLLLNERVPEGLHLDYKGGDIFVNEKGASTPGYPKTFTGKIRKHVSGFANADGGVLVLGVAEPPKDPTGKAVPGAKRPVDGVPMDAVALTNAAITTLHPYLSRPTRVHEVAHRDGRVVLAAVARSDSLVMCSEVDRAAVHYLRVYDGTIHAPGYLVEDLILGRRRKTSFVVANVRAHWNDTGCSISLEVINTGLVWMDDVRVGIAGYVKDPPGETFADPPPILQEVEVVNLSPRRAQSPGGLKVLPFRWPAGSDSIGPLHVAQFGLMDHLLPLNTDDIYGAAIFVVSRGQTPTWFQFVAYRPFPNKPDVSVTMLPLGERRPIVQVAQRDDVSWCKIELEPGRRYVARWKDGSTE